MKLIDEQLLKHVISYLLGRPYAEVYNTINALMHLPDAPLEKGENPDD